MPKLSHPQFEFVQSEGGAGQLLDTAGLLALLDELLAAERAGVRVASALRDDHPPGPIRTLLGVVHIDEAESCRLLANAIRALGEKPSSRVGDFAERALAIEGARERLAFLQRGQRWVVRRLEEAIPRTASSEVGDALREVLEIHRRNVAACEEVLASLDDPPGGTRPA